MDLQTIILVIAVPAIITLWPKVQEWIKTRGEEKRKTTEANAAISLNDSQQALAFVKGLLTEANAKKDEIMAQLRKQDEDHAVCRAENATITERLEIAEAEKVAMQIRLKTVESRVATLESEKMAPAVQKA